MSRCEVATRLLKLLHLLNKRTRSNKSTSIQEIQDYIEVSRRTVYRYLKALENANYPIAGNEAGGYHGGIKLVNPVEIPNRNLEINELLILQLAAEMVEEFEETSRVQLLKALLANMEFQLEPKLERELHRLKSLISVKTPSKRKSLGSKRIPDTIEKAMKTYKVIEIKYYSPKREKANWRAVHPYQELITSNKRYIDAFCESSNKVKTFALNRVMQVRETERSFTPKEGYDAKGRLENSFIVHDGDLQRVKLRFDAEKSFYVKERGWPSDALVKDLPDGRVEVSFDTKGLVEIQAFILGWGGCVEVLEPLALRKKIHDAACMCVKNNSSPLEQTEEDKRSATKGKSLGQFYYGI